MLDNLRILYLTADASLYGSNKSLLNLLSSLKMEKEHYCIITPYHGDFNKELDKLNIKNYVIKYHWECAMKGNGLYGLIKYIYKYAEKIRINFNAKKELTRMVKKHGVNLIHSNSSVLSLGFEVAKKLNIKHVWHIREFITLDYNLSLYAGKERYCKKINQSDAIICVTNSLLSFFKINEKGRVIYNAVAKESDVLDPVDKEAYFLFCGSFSQNKGLHIAIEAFAEICKADKKVTLKIAGSITNIKEQPYFSFILNMVKELEIVDRVEFLGYVNDIRTLMNKSAGLLVCSRHEGMGRVTAEAMLNNCLVIGNDDKAGTSELISHKKTGLLFSSKEELVSAMAYATAEKSAVAQMIQQAKEYALNNFTEEVFRNRLVSVYESVL